MNRNKIYFAFLILLLCMAKQAHASHIKGGWIYYEYLGKGIYDTSKLRYRINIKVYRDCNTPNPGQNDDPLQLTIYNNDSIATYSSVNIPLNRVDTMDMKSYSACLTIHPSICYRILVYTQVVELLPNSNGYTLTYQRCCRISGLQNIVAPSSSYGNTYSTTIPGTAVNPGFMKNNSPIFAQKDTILICYKLKFNLDFSAIDPDGDSLVYHYSDPINGGSLTTPIPIPSTPASTFSSIPFSNGYTASNPFGTYANINKATGIIDGLAPSIPGEYVLSVSVDEYRNGMKLGTTRKELHLFIGSCALSAAALYPTAITCNGTPINFQNQSSASSIIGYHWDFGVKNSSTDTSTNATPSFLFPDTGVYTIKLVVDGVGGCSDSAFSQVKVYSTDLPKVVISASQYPAFNDAKVMFTAHVINGFDSSSITWYKNHIIVGTNTLVYQDSGMLNGDSIWCIYQVNNACIVNNIIYSDTIKMNIQQGRYVSGNILNPKGISIPNAMVNITGGINDHFIAPSSYVYELADGFNYSFHLTKNNDIIKSNGISTIDAALVQSHVLGKLKLNSPYKLIAADVNADGKISALDIVMIKRIILGLDSSFINTKTAESRLWAFIDSSYQFPDTTNPFPFKDSIHYIGLNANQINQTFIGVKLGDVNWDWNPSLARKVIKPEGIKPKQLEISQ